MTENCKQIKDFVKKNEDSLFQFDKGITEIEDYMHYKKIKRSQPISSSWMGICLLSLQSPSNLDVGLEVNCRTANEERLLHTDEINTTPIAKTIYDKNYTFQNNALDCTFFKLKNAQYGEPALASFFTPKSYEAGEDNVVEPKVVIRGYTGVKLDSDDIACLAVIFNVFGLSCPED